MTIAKNINHLITSGFEINLDIYRPSHYVISSITEFILFYSRRFINTLEDIKFSIHAEKNAQLASKYKDTLSIKLRDTIGPVFHIRIVTEFPNYLDFHSSLYDSFVITPFAMDELVHPDNWEGTIPFSLIDNIDKGGNIMGNGDGLLTWNGIKKPWWHAYILFSKLKGNIISRGADHIITRNNNIITILTYNTCSHNI